VKLDNPNRNIYLLTGGLFSLAFAVFQVSAVFWPPEMLTFFGGPVEMQAENPLMYIFVCVVIGAIIAVAGLYALSGAGIFRRLPLLRTMLVGITAVFILRGLAIINDLRMINEHPELNLGRFVVFSLFALCVGLVHLIGVIRLFRKG
jgi:putative oxidoreductase